MCLVFLLLSLELPRLSSEVMGIGFFFFFWCDLGKLKYLYYLAFLHYWYSLSSFLSMEDLTRNWSNLTLSEKEDS